MAIMRQCFNLFRPNSAFGITLATFVVMILIVGFFVHDIQLVSLNGELDNSSGLLADRALILPSDQAKRDKSKELFQSKFDLFDDEIDIDQYAETDDLNVPTQSLHVAKLDSVSSVPVKPSGRYSSNPAAPIDISKGHVASLGRMSDCRWIENTGNFHEGVSFKVGQTLNIAAGLMEIVFGCGATAVVEGPAVLEIESDKSSTLQFGKLTANVPDQVEGFTVHTPTVKLVSLCRMDSKGVAKLTSIYDCQWSPGAEGIKEGSCLLPGQEVKLDTGLAEITFNSGAKVILQGPAHLEIESAKAATLRDGRMTADVPDDLEGFSIHTTVAEILSLPAEIKK